MNRINTRTLDLNLLRMLVAMDGTGSVSRSAELIGLSQPAASNALKRLRVATGDPLFVRSKQGMVATDFARSIIPGVREHLDGLFDALGGQTAFHPSKSTRVFRLSLSGLGELAFLPKLAGPVFSEAPKVKIHNTSVPADRLADALEAGDIDCAIGIIDVTAQGIRTKSLFGEHYVAVAGTALKHEPRSVDALRGHQLAVSAPAVSYATDIANLLDHHGLQTSVALQLANFGALPHLLATLPFASIVPGQYARQLEDAGQGRILPIELTQPGSTVRMVWHVRSDADDACMWLRRHIVEQLGEPELRGTADSYEDR